MRKLTVTLFVVAATIASSTVSLAYGVSASLPVSLRPSFSHDVLQMWDAATHARQTVEGENAFIGSWYIILHPGAPVSSGTTVTVYAIYDSSDPTVGGTLDIQLKNASSTCYGADVMFISGTLPVNPTNGVPYDIGSFTVYNNCGSNKILKVYNIQSSVDGAPINWQQSINFIVEGI
ncbi:hypothetical protein KK083_02130 [Fulvivirgaceae bacterium PWU4]|uniref:Lipocalin-like domain-containing protein n=1 Tax=Chryseosolibacter histidini TaxID=2782349 RepID=A0AAP2DFW1_9BACT|nr:hypothetical protein [Chryseosolibacter histidini]MBT1695656.1 hypothetical protein [Chryseosolibacter histidini]